jgi:hypothetical protein
MASHFRLKKYQLWSQGILTGTTTITSNVVEIINLDNIFLELVVSGTPSGAFSVQVSSDHMQDQEENVLVEGHWINLSLSPAPSVSGSAVNIGIDLNQLGASYLRVQYTNTASSGHVDGFVSGKALM